MLKEYFYMKEILSNTLCKDTIPFKLVDIETNSFVLV